MSQNPSQHDPEPDAEEEDQDAGPSTMAPPGEGADEQGQVG